MTALPRAIPVAVALASGLATAGLLYAYLASIPKAAPAPSVPMVVAAASLQAQSPLEEANLKVVEVHELPPGAFSSLTAVKGRLPLVPIGEGEPILQSHLANPGAKPGLPYKIPPGMRAMSIAIDEVAGVAGFVRPGMTVDVIGVTRNREQNVSRLVAQDLTVLAIAQDDTEQREGRQVKIAPSATLLVSPAQAEAISLAAEQGAVRLALRGAEDHHLVKAPAPASPKQAPVIIRTVVRVPAPAPKAPEPARVVAPVPRGVEVISGSQKEVVQP